jgi:hypothetical protein
MRLGVFLSLLLLIGLARLVQGAEGITVSEPTVYLQASNWAANRTAIAFSDLWEVKIYALGEEIGKVHVWATDRPAEYPTPFSNNYGLEFYGYVTKNSLIPGFDHFYIEFTAKRKDDPNWVKNVKKYPVNIGSLDTDIREYTLGTPYGSADEELAEWGFTMMGEVHEFLVSDIYVEFSVKGNIYKFNLRQRVPSINLTLVTYSARFKESALADSGDMGNGWWYWKLELKDWDPGTTPSGLTYGSPPEQPLLWSEDYDIWEATAIFNTEPKPMYAKVALIGDNYNTSTLSDYMIPQKYDAYVLAFFNQTGGVKGQLTARLVRRYDLTSFYRDLLTVPVDITITETGSYNTIKPEFTQQTSVERVSGTWFSITRTSQRANFTEPVKLGRYDYVTFSFHYTAQISHIEYIWVRNNPYLQALETTNIQMRGTYGRYIMYGFHKYFIPYSPSGETLSGHITHTENGWVIPSKPENYKVDFPYIEVRATTDYDEGTINITIDDVTVTQLPTPRTDPLPLYFDPVGRPVSKQQYDLSMEAFELYTQAEIQIEAAINSSTNFPIFESAEAKNALREAQNESLLAWRLFVLSYNFTGAKQHAQNAVDLIESAYSIEQSYQTTQFLMKWSPIIALVAIIGVGTGALILKKEKKMKPQTLPEKRTSARSV